MRPSEILIPFTHPQPTPPSYSYHPPFIFMIWTLKRSTSLKVLYLKEDPGGPQEAL